MRKGSRVIGLWLAALVVAGCATGDRIDIASFEAYHEAVAELGTSAGQALAFEREWAYENYMAALAAGGHERPSDVILQFPADGPFAWALADAPIFVDLRQTEAKLARINDVFERYTALLVTLAGGEADDGERIERLAGRLNENARSAAGAVGLDLDAGQGALFATAAATAAQAWLANRRAGDLAAVLAANQGAVADFAELGAAAAETAAVGIKDAYQDATQRWIARVVEAGVGARAGLVEEQLATNARTIGQLRGLEQIRDGYLALADTHAQLGRGLASGRLPDVQALVERATAIRALYQRLSADRGDEAP